MKSMAAVSVIVAITALPVCAQRGVARGGFAGPGVFAGHGGVSAPTASRFAAPMRPFAFPSPSTLNRSLRVDPASHPASFNHYPPHAPYLPVYRRRGVYISPVWPGVYPYYFPYSGYPWFFDNGDDSQSYPNNEQAPPPDYGAAHYPDYGPAPYPDSGAAPYPGYGAAPYPYYAPVPPSAQSQSLPSPLPPYTYYSVPPAATYYVVPPVAPPAEETPVTLIFRNGRAPEQIHNYLLTRTTITVLDQPFRQIPLDQIDIAATTERNREAGIDFRIPGPSR